MLAKKNRLSKKADFKKIFQSGRRLMGDYFQIRYYPNKLDYCRFAVVASTKVSKKAVIRNYLKRQVREIIKNNLVEFNQNLDVIINILPKAVQQKSKTLQGDLAAVLKKIN